MRAYFAAGCPLLDGVKPSRFPDWDRFVRLPIIWAGGYDIQPAMDRVLGEDPKRAMLGGLLQAWYAVYGDQEKVLAHVISELGLRVVHARGAVCGTTAPPRRDQGGCPLKNTCP